MYIPVTLLHGVFTYAPPLCSRAIDTLLSRTEMSVGVVIMALTNMEIQTTRIVQLNVLVTRISYAVEHGTIASMQLVSLFATLILCFAFYVTLNSS